MLICYSIPHMEHLVAHLIALKVMQTENFLLNSGIYRDMNDTRTADLYSIHKSMVRFAYCGSNKFYACKYPYKCI